jgi:hypothetical protein
VNWSGALSATGADISGTINASDGSFNGTITAKDGSIGGWEIGETTLTGGAVELNSGGSITVKDASTFHVSSTGSLTCTSATIGGWSVSDSSGGFSSAAGFTVSPTGGLSFPGAAASFGVDANGKLTATGADITGKITATEGEIGGWTINANSISSGAGGTGLVLNSEGSILVGDTKLTSTGFFSVS